ncbi:hypothetical protein Q5752_004725 [Cryptotrichosporon argae]
MTSSSTAAFDYVVGRRYLHAKSGLPVTLRYIGPLPPSGASSSSSPIWLGIEYDDVSRGKHSGTYEGVQVFATRVEGAGSFVKLAGRPLVEGLGFGQAVAERYGVDLSALGVAAAQAESSRAASGGQTSGTADDVKLGDSSIIIEAPNMDGVRRRVGQLGRIRQMGLDGMWVSHLDGAVGRAVLEQLGGLGTLNMSRNLFSTWADIAEIANALPALRELVLHGSRIDRTENDGDVSVPHVLELDIGACDMSWSDAVHAASHFPKLDALHASANPLAMCTPAPTLKIQHLSLSHCPIREWEQLVLGPGSIPTLKWMDISFVPLSTIPPRPAEYDASAFPSIKSITWFGARIDAADLDALDAWTAGRLRAVRITFGSAAHDGSGADDERAAKVHRRDAIARLSGVEHVNGTPVTPTERRDAEVAYVAAAEQSGSAQTWRRPAAAATLGSRMIAVTLHSGEDIVDFKVLPSSRVSVLRKKMERRAGRAGTLWTARPEGDAWERASELEDEAEVGWWVSDGDHLVFA